MSFQPLIATKAQADALARAAVQLRLLGDPWKLAQLYGRLALWAAAGDARTDWVTIVNAAQLRVAEARRAWEQHRG